MLKKLDWWRKKCDNFIWFFLFNLDCTFFRDLNQVRSTSLKLDKYFSSFVQEKCSIEISFLSYISTIALFLFLERIVLSFICCFYRSILYWSEYTFFFLKLWKRERVSVIIRKRTSFHERPGEVARSL